MTSQGQINEWDAVFMGLNWSKVPSGQRIL